MMHQAGQHVTDFSKSMRSLVITKPNLPHEDQLDEYRFITDNEKRYRKYFSKKVQKIFCIFKPSSSAFAYRYKNVRHLRLDGHVLLKNTPLKTVKKLTLLHTKGKGFRSQNNGEMKPSFLDHISDYKSLQSLKLVLETDIISLNKLRVLRNIKEISLVILTHHMLLENAKTLLSLPSLRKFTLSLHEVLSAFRHDGIILYTELMTQTTLFCTELLNTKRLRSMYLNLSALKSRQESVCALLDSLKGAQLSDFHVKISLSGDLELLQVQDAIDNYADLVIMDEPNFMLASVTNSNSTQGLAKPPLQASRILEFIIECNKRDNIINQESQDIDYQRPFVLFESLSILSRKMRGSSWPSLDQLTALHLRSFTLSFINIDKMIEDKQ